MRAITAGDASLLRHVTLQSVLDAPYAFGGAETYGEEAARPDSHWSTFAAELAGEVPEWRDRCIGYFIIDGPDAFPCGKAICTVALRNPKLSLLTGMWIDPRHRRKGLGKTLVDAWATWATTRGAERLKLWVDDTNPEGVAFYKALGFTPTGESRPVAPGSPNLERSFARSLVAASPAHE